MAVEDNIDEVVYATFFKNVRRGVIVDVGAARPDYLSISALFRKAGWKVVAIEPNPNFCAQHIARGYEVYEYACSDQDMDNVEFFIVESKDVEYLDDKISYESVSSLGIKDEFKELYEKINDNSILTKILVRTRKLDTILALHEPDINSIELLTMDIEGWELTALRGFSFEKYKPRVVILENLISKHEYRDFMQEKGYMRWLRLGGNEIYIRSEMETWKLRVLAARLDALHRFNILKQRITRKIGEVLAQRWPRPPDRA